MLTRPFLALLVLLAAGSAAAVEDKWEITTTMQATGMPFLPPATTTTLCLPQNQPVNEKMIPAKDNCKVSKFTTSGNTSKFHIECAPPQQMSGDGEFTYLGNAYNGKMNVKGNMGGQNIDMQMSYAGKKIGVCGGENDNAYSPMKMMQQGQGQMAMACAQMAEGMSWQMAPNLASMCPTLQADICKRANARFAGVTSADALLALQEDRPDWKELAGYCAIDTTAMTRKLCASSKAGKDYNGAVLICGSDDPELFAIAQKECVGFDVTGNRISEKTRPLCNHFADRLPKSAGKKTATAPASSLIEGYSNTVDTGNNAIDTTQRAVEGYKKLKGLFGR